MVIFIQFIDKKNGFSLLAIYKLIDTGHVSQSEHGIYLKLPTEFY